MSSLPAPNHVRECPHCGIGAQFINQFISSIESMRENPRNEKSPRKLNQVAVYRCAICSGPLFVHVSGTSLAIVEIYPSSVPNISSEIPSPIREILIEAISCFGVLAWNATATMCRRAIQETVIKLGGSGKDLYNQIEDLEIKRIITTDLRDWAHEIRTIGKHGAHADVPIDVTKSDAEDALDFTQEFLNYTYVLKNRLQRRVVKAPMP